MPFQLVAHTNRTKPFTITIKGPSGGYVELQDTDVVRVKIHRSGTTVLDLDNVATTNGSRVSISQVGNGSSQHAQAILTFNQLDLNGLKGMYDMEISIVDDSDSDYIKAVETGAIEVIASPDGDIGLT